MRPRYYIPRRDPRPYDAGAVIQKAVLAVCSLGLSAWAAAYLGHMVAAALYHAASVLPH